MEATACHILYLDDESGLVYLLARYGQRLGYRVTGHTDAREALEDFNARPDEFDVVVTDLSMPGISGMEFAREVLHSRPAMPVILTTGSIRPEDVTEAEQLGVRYVMAKPNTVQALAEALHQALADPIPSKDGGALSGGAASADAMNGRDGHGPKSAIPANVQGDFGDIEPAGQH